MAWHTLLPLVLAGTPAAMAQEPFPPAPELAGASGIELNRKTPMEINLRSRWLTLPSSILDIWYFNENDPGANPLARPRTQGFAVGVEYVLKPQPTNWIFYMEYAGSLMPEGYWDDIEEPAQHDDGDYIRPDGFGLMVAGANYAHEIQATPWMSFLVGGGLGLAVVTGELTQWNGGDGGGGDNTESDCLSSSPAYERVDVCADDGPKRIPGVLPMVDISAGIRFNLGDSANIRLEGGIHDLVYTGAAFGVMF